MEDYSHKFSRIWVGDSYRQHRTLILGLSYHGVWEGDMETDATYIAEYVAGRLGDALYSKIDKSVGLSRPDFWHQVAFTNMVVGSVGPNSSARTSDDMVRAGMPRLRLLLQKHAPERVWLLAKQLEAYAGRVCDEKGIPWVSIAHPTGVNNRSKPVTPSQIKDTWERLLMLGPKPSQVGHSGCIGVPPIVDNETPPKTGSQRLPHSNAPRMFPETTSRNTDPNERRWKALGFGHKTSDCTTWRYWSEAAGKGPWRIAAPHNMAEYRLVDRRLFLDEEFILEGKTQWDATWAALGHFYSRIVPNLPPPPILT